MEENKSLKSTLLNDLKKFNFSDTETEKLSAELDILSNLIIDYYLEINKDKEEK